MMGGDGSMMTGAYLWAVLVLTTLALGAAGALIGGVSLARGARLAGTLRKDAQSRGEPARDILRRRFAEGHIDETEFLQRMSALSGNE